ncbi:MAG: adenylosuccinate synthase [Phycisphaeraceae bacterium]|nr:adenylosuccinate synthase [Phycisphaeraceae bacterium]
MSMVPDVADSSRPGDAPRERGAGAWERLVPSGRNACVVGLQFGDEGKGQIVDAITDRFDYVTRFNGGNNAGHSVRIGDQKFALHLIPSGILNPSAINVIGNGVVVDPEGILAEIDGLVSRGVAVGENLKISTRAHVVLPWHKTQDRLMELALHKSRGEQDTIGTTGRGIGPCYADKAQRSTAVRMGDLLHPDLLLRQLQGAASVKNVMLAALAAHLDEPFEPFEPRQLHETLLGQARRLAPHLCDTSALLRQAMREGRRVLFEGANAALLDVDHGTFPFVTSSNTTALGIHAGAGVPGGSVSDVLGVVKCYTSRVGGGPSATQFDDETANHLRKVGNEFGTTTGRPRRIGWLDLMAVRYAAQLNGCTGLVCTGLAVLSGLKTIRAATEYRLAGKVLTEFPYSADDLWRVEPGYAEFPGFEESISDCRRYEDLPEAARRFVREIARFVEVPVRAVCVGPAREQMLPVPAAG